MNSRVLLTDSLLFCLNTRTIVQLPKKTYIIESAYLDRSSGTARFRFLGAKWAMLSS